MIYTLNREFKKWFSKIYFFNKVGGKLELRGIKALFINEINDRIWCIEFNGFPFLDGIPQESGRQFHHRGIGHADGWMVLQLAAIVARSWIDYDFIITKQDFGILPFQ